MTCKHWYSILSERSSAPHHEELAPSTSLNRANCFAASLVTNLKSPPRSKSWTSSLRSTKGEIKPVKWELEERKKKTEKLHKAIPKD